MKLEAYLLTPTNRDIADTKAAFNLTRGRHWSIIGGMKTECLCNTDAESRKVRGKWRTVTHASHRATVQLYVRAENSGTRMAIYRLGKRKSKAVPQGYHLSVSSPTQCVLFRDSDGMDYHPTDGELRRFDFAGMIAKMETNATYRQAQKDREMATGDPLAINAAMAAFMRETQASI